MVDDWQYHQDSRDEAVGIGFVVFVIIAIVFLFVMCAVVAYA